MQTFEDLIESSVIDKSFELPNAAFITCCRHTAHPNLSSDVEIVRGSLFDLEITWELKKDRPMGVLSHYEVEDMQRAPASTFSTTFLRTDTVL